MLNCIGLFGTCSGSKWRDRFIEVYREENIRFFDPVVADWTPASRQNEIIHMRTDDVIVMMITDEAYSLFSLMECGILLKEMAANPFRHLIIGVDRHLDPMLSSNQLMYENSLAMRERILEELKEPMDNVYPIFDINDAIAVSRQAYETTLIRRGIRSFIE